MPIELICPTWVIPIEPEGVVWKNFAIVLADGKILDILPQEVAHKKYTSADILALPDHVLLPGFINAHTHSPMSLLRGIANDLPLMEWLTQHIWPYEKKWLNEAFVRDAMQLALGEMLKNGTTCFNEHYFFPNIIAETTIAAGMRACIGPTILDIENAWSINTKDAIAKTMEVYAQYSDHNFINICWAPHSPYSLCDDSLKLIKKAADKLPMHVHMHVHETNDEIHESLKLYNKRPLQRLYDLGLLSSHFEGVHMTQIDDEDLAIVEKTGLHIIHCPESNLKLASGFCPVQKLLDVGANIAIGTDSVVSNNDLDMLVETRTGALLAKVFSNNPSNLSSATALSMATINGAKAVGLDDKIGSIKIGKWADLIAINLAALATQPVYDPIAQIVYATGHEQIKYVWVAGKKLMNDGQLTTLNEAAIIQKAKEWGEKIKPSA